MKKKRTVLTRLPKAQEGMPVMAPGSRPEQQAMPQQEMQQGAPPPQQQGGDPQMEALLQQVQQMAQQGADPMQIIGSLLQNGLAPEIVMQVILQVGIAQSEEQASQMIQETMAQMQQGAEQQADPNEVNEQPMMDNGGEVEDGTYVYKNSQYKKRDGIWYKHSGDKFVPLKYGNIEERIKVLEKNATPVQRKVNTQNDGAFTSSVSYDDQGRIIQGQSKTSPSAIASFMGWNPIYNQFGLGPKGELTSSRQDGTYDINTSIDTTGYSQGKEFFPATRSIQITGPHMGSALNPNNDPSIINSSIYRNRVNDIIKSRTLQGGGKKSFALGGETELNSTIQEFAELTGQSEEAVTEMVQAMIQQTGDANEVAQKLEEAIMQIQQQTAQPQGMGAGMQQSMPGESQIAPPSIPSEGQTTMRYGGPTPKDFKDLEKEMIKQYRKGGTTNGFDTSSSNAYVQSLKGSIANWVTTNNKIGLVKQRTEKNLALFDELPESVAMTPRANKGIEIDKLTDEADKKYYTELKDKFKDYETADWTSLNKAYSEGKMTEGEFMGLTNLYGITKPQAGNTTTNTDNTTNTNSGTSTNTEMPMQGETYAQYANRTGKSYSGQYGDRLWNGTQWTNNPNSSQTQHYFPGQESDYGRSLSGARYNSTNPFIASVTDMVRGYQRNNFDPLIKGIGALSGSDQAAVVAKMTEVLKNPDKYKVQVEDINAVNPRTGKTKRRKVGKRIMWNPITGAPTTTPTAGKTETYNPETKEWTFGDEPTATSATNIPPKVDEAQMLKNLQSEDKWIRKQAEEYFANQDKEDKESGKPPKIYTDEEISKLATSEREKEQLINERDKLLKENPELKSQGPKYNIDDRKSYLRELEDWEYSNLFDQAEAKLKKENPNYTEDDVINEMYESYDPNNPPYTYQSAPAPDELYFKGYSLSDQQVPNEILNQFYIEKDGEKRMNSDLFSQDPIFSENEILKVPKTYKDFENYRTADGKRLPTVTGKFDIGPDQNYYWLDYYQTGSTGYDPEKGFYDYGGETNGGIIWDFHNKRFTKMPNMLVARNGLYTPGPISVPMPEEFEEGVENVWGKERERDWDRTADNIYAMGSNIAEKKRLMNALTTSDQAAINRAGMFNPITPRSGGEGIYTQWGDLIADRTGAKALPGTGTDQLSYGEGMPGNINKDINPGGVNLFRSKNGALLKYAQNGLEINQEYDLSEDDINELLPYLQQLGLKLEMIK